jgi:hypothetical protein
MGANADADGTAAIMANDANKPVNLMVQKSEISQTLRRVTIQQASS